MPSRRADSPRARHLARRLVELHRLEQTGRGQGPDPVLLGALDLVKLTRTIAGDYAGVEVRASQPQLELASDSRQLAGILFELLDNATLHGRAPISVDLDRGAIMVSD